ncbi:transposable element Tcb2 transposase [Trichonephila clavipes]|nr:transposable element Tcb2 transposase [Trichonephila clavipes]
MHLNELQVVQNTALRLILNAPRYDSLRHLHADLDITPIHNKIREAGRRAVLLARWIVRSVPLEIVGSSGHEKVPTRRKPGLERPGRPRGERSKDRAASTCGPYSDSFNDTSRRRRSNCSRHLAEANLKSKHTSRALSSTPEHRPLRLQWCHARSIWNVTDWQKVVFRDESRFVLGTDNNRVRVWRHPGVRYNSPHTVLPHTAHTAGVIVWGAIAYDSLSTLIVMRGTLTGQRYVDDILRPYVGPSLNGLPVAIFQQEHVWDQLKRQMSSCHSVYDLELAVQDLWAHLPQDNIRCLINLMPDRVAACIAAGGGPKRY